MKAIFLRTFFSVIILVYSMGLVGCAAAWFIAGAGAGATTLAVMDSNKKSKEETKTTTTKDTKESDYIK